MSVRRFVSIHSVVGILVAAMMLSCSRESGFRTISGAVWGTTFHITYKAPDDLTDSIFSVMSEIDNTLSMFNPASTVSRINAGDSVVPDQDILAVWSVSEAVNEASGGVFDPTVAPLVDLWGFGRKGRDVPVPDSAEVAEALAGVGMDKWVVAQGTAVVRPTRSAALDFSAVAKGYGVDCIARMLERNGCIDYMVEVGGEIALRGSNPRGQKWRVQIDAPVDTLPGMVAGGFLDTTDCCIATSGNYRNYRTDSVGHQYGHTIDPLTGFPRTKSHLSVTVVAPTCALADALATALMAGEPDSVKSITGRFDAKAIIVD